MSYFISSNLLYILKLLIARTRYWTTSIEGKCPIAQYDITLRYFWGRNNWLLLLWCPSQSRPQSLRAFGEGMKDRTIARYGDENKTIVSVLVQQRPLTVFPTAAGEFSSNLCDCRHTAAGTAGLAL